MHVFYCSVLSGLTPCVRNDFVCFKDLPSLLTLAGYLWEIFC